MKINFNDFCVNELIDKLADNYKSANKKSIKKKKEKKVKINENTSIPVDAIEKMISKEPEIPSSDGMDIFIDGVLPD